MFLVRAAPVRAVRAVRAVPCVRAGLFVCFLCSFPSRLRVRVCVRAVRA